MTVVYDLKKSRLVWVGDGRTRETLERFFDFLGEDRSKRLEAVCCDMWRSYVNAVRARAPQALIVFDKFHIVSHLGRRSTMCAERRSGRRARPTRTW